ncbi:ABC transporter permease [Colwelliaceae bacterium 6471]
MWQIYLKELLELVRDRKTLFFIIALPLLIFPVIFAVMGVVVANVAMDEQQKVLKYTLINADKAPKFSQTLFYHRDFTQIDLSLNTDQEIKQAIQNGQIDVVIKVNQSHEQNIANNQKDNWQIYFNGASQLNSVKSKVDKVFLQYSNTLRQQKLAELSLSEQQYERLTTPISLEVINTADQRENVGEQVGGLLPYLLIVLCLTGAMYPAIDLGAGEKERGTLETLLLTPISRISIVLGKYLTIMTTGIITALIAVFSLSLWSFIIGEFANIDVVREVFASFTASDLLLILLMLVPVSGIFAGLLLSISIYARSFKEAQNYMGPVSMLGFFPIMVAMLPGIKLDWLWSLVPISNVALAIKEILKGTIDYTMLIYILMSSTVFAILSIIFCVYWFKKESVLFR